MYRNIASTNSTFILVRALTHTRNLSGTTHAFFAQTWGTSHVGYTRPGPVEHSGQRTAPAASGAVASLAHMRHAIRSRTRLHRARCRRRCCRFRCSSRPRSAAIHMICIDNMTHAHAPSATWALEREAAPPPASAHKYGKGSMGHHPQSLPPEPPPQGEEKPSRRTVEG